MKRLVIITGTSKGFGRALAQVYSKTYVNDEIAFVLSGRDLQQLQSLKNEISHNSAHHQAVGHPVDFSNLESLDRISTQLFDEFDWFDYDQIVYISNAGSLGPLAPVGSASIGLSGLSEAISTNITSYIYLTSEFVKRFVSLPL